MGRKQSWSFERNSAVSPRNKFEIVRGVTFSYLDLEYDSLSSKNEPERKERSIVGKKRAGRHQQHRIFLLPS